MRSRSYWQTEKISRGRCRNQSMSPGAASVEQARTEQMVREDKTERVPQSRAAERGDRLLVSAQQPGERTSTDGRTRMSLPLVFSVVKRTLELKRCLSARTLSQFLLKSETLV